MDAAAASQAFVVTKGHRRFTSSGQAPAVWLACTRPAYQRRLCRRHRMTAALARLGQQAHGVSVRGRAVRPLYGSCAVDHPAQCSNLHISASACLLLAVAVPADLGIAGRQTDGRAGDQQRWVRIVSSWVHLPLSYRLPCPQVKAYRTRLPNPSEPMWCQCPLPGAGGFR